MLEDARTDLAWLRDSRHKVALRVRSRAAEPTPSELCFFAPDFALNDVRPWHIGEEIGWPDLAPLALPALAHRAEPSAPKFDALHADVLARIADREFDKVVPIVCEDLEFASPLAASMFPNAFAPGAHQFGYGLQHGDEGLAGLTPELLFAVEDGVLHTMALAGTGRADGPALLDDPKEKREHDIVIEHITSEVKAWGRVDVGATQERAFGVLKHLYTPIRVDLARELNFLEIVVRLHPTAALGGWPRQPAVEWLQRQPFHVNRRRFGAPFGWQRAGAMTCVVAIRCLQWWGARALLSAGCGVVVGSEALKEWRELKLKRDATCRGLGVQL